MAKDLDPITLGILKKLDYLEGIDAVSPPKDMPASAAFGIPNLRLYRDRWMDPSLEGYVVTPKEDTQAEQLRKAQRQTPAIFLAPSKVTDKPTIAHEAEHLLARQQFGRPAGLNTAFDKMVNNPEEGNALRKQFVTDASKAYPYLKKTYGIDSGYFMPEMLRSQGPLAPNLAYEMMAELVAIEAATGKDLTKDPYLRKNLFKTREVREIYNALTGLRQTRLDAKDLPPHTRQKETGSNALTDIAESLTGKRFGFKAGGAVDKPLPGGKKLI